MTADVASPDETRFREAMLEMPDVSSQAESKQNTSGTSESGVQLSQEDVFDIALLNDFGSTSSQKPVYAAKGMRQGS